MKKARSMLLLILTAFIWGSAFVAQSEAADVMGAFSFNSIRNFVGCLALIPVILIFDHFKKKSPEYVKPNKKDNKTLIIGGICCGICLAVASTLQQLGIEHTSVGKAGFLTALYIVIVPVFSIFLKKKTSFLVWIAVAIAVVGMYLLCITESFSISLGDTYVILCAVCYTFHILIIDHFSPKVDGVKMSCIQFLTVGIICAVPALLFEKTTVPQITAAVVPILYTGIMSSGIAYTLQIVSQKHIAPQIASLVMSLESVFAALCGWLILGEQLKQREFIGCILIFTSIILTQLPDLIGMWKNKKSLKNIKS